MFVDLCIKNVNDYQAKLQNASYLNLILQIMNTRVKRMTNISNAQPMSKLLNQNKIFKKYHYFHIFKFPFFLLLYIYISYYKWPINLFKILLLRSVEKIKVGPH